MLRSAPGFITRCVLEWSIHLARRRLLSDLKIDFGVDGLQYFFKHAGDAAHHARPVDGQQLFQVMRIAVSDGNAAREITVTENSLENVG